MLAELRACRPSRPSGCAAGSSPSARRGRFRSTAAISSSRTRSRSRSSPAASSTSAPIVYLGAKRTCPRTRLATELGQLGAWFQLKPDAHGDLAAVRLHGDREAGPRHADGGRERRRDRGAPSGRSERARCAAHRSCTRSAHACRALAMTSARRRSADPARATCTPSIVGRASRSHRPARAAAPCPYALPVAAPNGRRRRAVPPSARQPSHPDARARAAAGAPTPARPQRRDAADPATGRTVFAHGRVATAPVRWGGPRQIEHVADRAGVADGARQRALTSTDRTRRSPRRRRRNSRAVATAAAPATRRSRRDSAGATTRSSSCSRSRCPHARRGVDHFTLLGVPMDASAAEFAARTSRSRASCIPIGSPRSASSDEERRAQRLMAQVNLAFAVLNDTREARRVRRRCCSAVARPRAKPKRRKPTSSRCGSCAPRKRSSRARWRCAAISSPQAVEAFKMAVELQPQRVRVPGDARVGAVRVRTRQEGRRRSRRARRCCARPKTTNGR